MLSAYNILDMAENRDLMNLGEQFSDTSEQLKSNLTLGEGMEGGFNADEQARLRSEYGEAQGNIRQNYATKRAIIREQQRQIKEQRQNRGGLLKGLGGIAAGAASFLPGIGPFAGAALGGALGAAGSYQMNEPIDIDWDDLYNKWRARR